MSSSAFARHLHPAFLRTYRFLPHRLMNRGLRHLTALRRPAWAVQAVIQAWSRLARIDPDGFEDRTYGSIDEFFLRQLRPGERRIGPGFVSPADGILIDAGTLHEGRGLPIKGQRLSLDRIVNAGTFDLDLGAYEGGAFAVVFLTPRGYHHVHAPADLLLQDARWIPGRFFPQNPTALEHIPRVYERNERAVLRFARPDGAELLLVMVGASLIGGIHLDSLPRATWARERVAPVGVHYRKGERVGHFAFGSTVVLVLPRGVAGQCVAREAVRMGETLFEGEG